MVFYYYYFLFFYFSILTLFFFFFLSEFSSVLVCKLNDGTCNHMKCSFCQTEFCWLCLKEVSDMHFLSPSGCTFYAKKPWSTKKKVFFIFSFILTIFLLLFKSLTFMYLFLFLFYLFRLLEELFLL